MPEVVVVHVVPVHQLDSTHILRRQDSFEARNQQPYRKTLVGPHRLAVHAVGHENVVHGLGDRHARRAHDFLRAFCNEPFCCALDAGLLEQRRQEHSGPFGTAGHPVGFLDGLRRGPRAVARALDEVKAGDRREALQVVHGERQRTVHQAMDHQAMLLRIDIRQEGAAGRRPVVERGWRDHPHRILERGRHVKNEPEGIGRRPAAVGDAYRGHELGAVAVGDQLLGALEHRRGCRYLSRYLCLGDRRRDGSQGETAGQRGAALQEFPSTRSFRTHRSLLRK